MIYECTIRNKIIRFRQHLQCPNLKNSILLLILKFYIALKSQRTACKKYTYVYLESLAIEFSRSFAAKCECRPLSFFLTISLGFSTMLQLRLTYSILYIKCISINNNILLKLADLYPTRVYESDECKMHGEKFDIQITKSIKCLSKTNNMKIPQNCFASFSLLCMHTIGQQMQNFMFPVVLARHTNSCVKQTSRKATNVRKSLTYPSSSIVKYSNLSEI